MIWRVASYIYQEISNVLLSKSIERMRKRLKRTKGICSCSSPLINCKNFTILNCLKLIISHSYIYPKRYEQDLWTYIARFLDGRSLVMLGTTNKWFNSVIMQNCIWKFTCLRDLQVPDPGHVAFSWSKLYASVVDGSHSFIFRQQEKHIDWMRIGAFSFDSEIAFLSQRMSASVKIPKQENIDDMLQSCGSCLLRKIKTGIWIAGTIYNLFDAQYVTKKNVKMLDARHIELFLNQGFQDGSWDYELVGSHEIKKKVRGAYGAIFDFKYLTSKSTAGIFDYKSWIGQPNDFQPKAIIALHAVAVNTNLQENQGVLIKYHTMRAGAEGEIVSIRISQQLL
ncbi:putative F-box protein isoform X2 [Gossypium australe]|uniref:Putative F-box protein isoform X2 n=1 Tax=Gossypium australe TaxID=47621 RepID=A0A5B6VQT9_9ROSI|nr:putative F-box protein isoform X2 [Gossypium australe]